MKWETNPCNSRIYRRILILEQQTKDPTRRAELAKAKQLIRRQRLWWARILKARAIQRILGLKYTRIPLKNPIQITQKEWKKLLALVEQMRTASGR